MLKDDKETAKEEAEAFERRETADRKEAYEHAKKGTPVEVREVPMFLRDSDDYETGDPMWQDVHTHNIVVKLLQGTPLSKGDMSFLDIQNQHLKKGK